MIEACREMGVRRLVYTSSIHALGRAEGVTTMDETIAFDQVNPSVPTTGPKQLLLRLCRKPQNGLDAVIVFPTGVIGPSDFRRSEMGEMLLGGCRRNLQFRRTVLMILWMCGTCRRHILALR